jgi:hypothetical protein
LADSTGAPAVIAVETAFHEDGLQYGSADEMIGRVLKKLIRAAFALEAYVDAGEAAVIFATPKMAEPIRQGVQEHLARLEPLLSRQANLAIHRMSFRIIANEEFASEVLEPVLSQVDAVADGSELFLRAQQLMRLCDPVRRQHSARPRIDHQLSVTADKGSRIGEHVRATMAQLAVAGRLTPHIVDQLLNARYCKATFNLGLPFLKAVDRAVELSQQRIDEKGYGCYWKQPLRIGSRDFLMCSQWFVWQRDAFDRWARDLVGRCRIELARRSWWFPLRWGRGAEIRMSPRRIAIADIRQGQPVGRAGRCRVAGSIS